MRSGNAYPAQKTSEVSWDELHQFREEHASLHTDYQGIQWEYITGGGGSQVLLILPGAFRRAESAFHFIRLFEDTYRIIAPSYPPLSTVERMVDGIVHFLSLEGVQTAFILGQSYGGWIGQLLVRCHPAMFSRLVLSSTGPLVSTTRERSLLPKVLKLLPILPMSLVKGLLAKGFRTELAHFPAAVRPFWEAYSAELFSRMSRADILSHFQVAQDAVKRGLMFNPGERSLWQGRLL
ncbi:alpha/beta hydrolase, partial [bacterium]